ncbi:MAG: glycosyltransferase [Bacteroidetes bacterium]|nr:glycosyltransferase [Bacteroidota bacterium]
MELLLTGITLLLVPIFLLVLVNMTAGPFLRSFTSLPRIPPDISVLVPARNEERNIGILLDHLRKQDYPSFTVTILDDRSDDGTADIVRVHCHADARIRLLHGEDPPEGWTGKNWACHQLSRSAAGDILLFVDADVRPSPHALSHTAAAFAAHDAAAVSAFPRQLLHGFAARLIVPIMDVILYAFLPLPLVHRTRRPSLAAANGQWIAFRRTAYDRIGGHAAVRDEIVEDIALARRVKVHGGTMLLTAGAGSVACGMYEGFAEVREGFSKNFFAAFGFNPIAFSIALLFMLAVFVLPYVMLFTPLWLAALPAVGLNLLFRLLLSWRAGHGPLTALLHPLGVLGAVFIGIEAMLHRYRRGAVVWKGRRIPVGGKGE